MKRPHNMIIRCSRITSHHRSENSGIYGKNNHSTDFSNDKIPVCNPHSKTTEEDEINYTHEKNV